VKKKTKKCVMKNLKKENTQIKQNLITPLDFDSECFQLSNKLKTCLL